MSDQGLSNERLAVHQAADLIHESFADWRDRFGALTRTARRHFERRDWQAMQRDSARRLDLHGEGVGEAIALLAPVLKGRLEDWVLWGAVREAYAARIRDRHDASLAETFFNSIVRQLFRTVGVDPRVEFVGPPEAGAGPAAGAGVTITFRREGTDSGSIERLVRTLLRHYEFVTGWDDFEGDAALIAARLAGDPATARLEAIDMALPVFFRGKGAYLVGRARTPAGIVPVLLALANPEGKVVADALLLTEDEVSIVFSFARSYFFVEMDRPRDLVEFLSAIMPRKPLAELYNAVGCDKHGKTMLYRTLLHHLETSDDRFIIAPGQRGMVMSVFALQGLDIVFKVIRDQFALPKTVTHDEVRAKYRLVFRHDRAGRLVDAQEFEHLTFDRARFEPDLLAMLADLAPSTVTTTADRVVIRHLYTERRLTPLDVYLKTAPEEKARLAVLDYGQVLRDLAATNIFPGDMLPKNFGVTRHGRLIFYDYDELSLLSDCRFRYLPPPADDWEEGAAEPAFHVGERDIFPEEFRAFLGFKGAVLQEFLKEHGALLTPRFWTEMQERLARGEVVDIYPYGAARRLRG
ncbi:MAG TPA: bifunctional isocitrate dehydrogenase kinase/phosphatase [Verrucomicrobiae bacterium]|nr:bifunctional isocitrate dehydrogenase kinase/phosphatase [Verrucomicrobiae bacterium]